MKKIPFYLEIAARWYVFLMISVYGWAKLFGHQFYRRGHLPEAVKLKTIETLSGFDLAWAFFGYSYPYILFIGVSQVIGAILLLFNRTKLLGAAILIPVLLNIIVVDICFSIHTGAMLNACFFLLMTLLMLYLNKERVVEVFKLLTIPGERLRLNFMEVLKTGGLFLLMIAVGMGFIEVFSYLIALIP